MLSVLGFQLASRAARPLALVLAGIVILALSASAAASRPATAASGRAPLAEAVVTQGFGCTAVSFEPFDPDCPNRHFHTGIDLAAAEGTPVYAVTAGTASVVLSTGGYGIHVLVTSAAGLVVLYGHLAGAAVQDGALLAAGSLLGWVGSTGNSTGPHLHFEVRRDGVPVDPSPWLPDYGSRHHQGGDQSWSTKSSWSAV